MGDKVPEVNITEAAFSETSLKTFQKKQKMSSKRIVLSKYIKSYDRCIHAPHVKRIYRVVFWR